MKYQETSRQKPEDLFSIQYTKSVSRQIGDAQPCFLTENWFMQVDIEFDHISTTIILYVKSRFGLVSRTTV